MTTIKSVHAREVLDSRGNPTVEVEVLLSDESFGRAIVPSGASTGSHEAVELRDGDSSRYMGKGVQKAVANVNTVLAPLVIGQNAFDQKSLDSLMIDADGTEQKSKLGANAILGVSLSVAKAAAASKKQALYQYIQDISETSTPKMPTPMMNVVNGGAHADSGLNIQEFMIFPTGAPKFSESLRMGAEVFHTLKKILASKGMVTAVGDEGGFAPRFSTNAEALDVILEAIQKAGHAGKFQLALDVAASEFYENGKYHFQGKDISSAELLAYYEDLLKTYPIISIEDGFAEDDFEGWALQNASMGDSIQIVGDDLLVTNTKRIEMAIEKKLCNALLVKPNQIGSLTETIQAVKMVQNAGWNSVMSHRSGESEDATIAHLAVGLATGQIKTGSLSRSDRIAKYNQLLRIEDNANGSIAFQGKIK